MQTLSFLSAVFVLLTLYVQSGEVLSSRKGRIGKRCLDKKAHAKALTRTRCPNGTACLPEKVGKRKKTCQECGCRLPEQCRKPLLEVICDCSNSGYIGSNCEIKLGQQCPVGQCPDGWTAFGGGCYLYVSARVNWTTANDQCKLICPDSYLVEITRSEETNFVSSITGLSKIWIGLSDIDSEDTFVWEYTGNELNYAPSNFYMSSLEAFDCVSSLSSNWYEDDCSYLRGFVCEITFYNIEKFGRVNTRWNIFTSVVITSKKQN